MLAMLDERAVDLCRRSGYGYGEIASLLATADRCGVPSETVAKWLFELGPSQASSFCVYAKLSKRKDPFPKATESIRANRACKREL